CWFSGFPKTSVEPAGGIGVDLRISGMSRSGAGRCRPLPARGEPWLLPVRGGFGQLDLGTRSLPPPAGLGTERRKGSLFPPTALFQAETQQDVPGRSHRGGRDRNVPQQIRY